ncbi:MAG: hypothetical protein KY428_05245, partial [Bacteroidetes bacterium]|nr:hypothetical protein [Bacteroidota bacterium]
MDKLFFLCLFAIFIASCREPSSHAGNAPIDTSWAMETLWDDGLAEVATYDARREVYGKTRQFEYTYITVKENFNKEFDVKTDDYSRSDLFPVMKVNKFARIPTDQYPYHYLTSLFYKREEPAQLYKMTTSSQEWCGNTFKLFQQQRSGYDYQWSSYWDGQGDGSSSIKNLPWFEDGLSHTLRTLQFKDGLHFQQPVLESQISNKATAPSIYDANLQVSSEQLGEKAAWKVVVQLDNEKTNTYWFAKEY